ncbi:transient receptor potential channel [Chlorella sorokiniana]|uniref:Transient receptor potential channel n=1 Tax=Chlorella sorokiniana TaxID=3076 RepID=A0A2P6TG68_CHLSO|nr:transient receptor potential channel [Chlorella sorokiniana]|eukprot:PRW33106.1 transient receptor potential channel [Chlorella sorokiniana]
MQVAQLDLQDKLVLSKIGDDSIITMGADRPDIDFEAAWKRELGQPAVTQTGWSSTIPVCAYVVSIRNAAAADKDGLLQPLLKRWQAGGLSYTAFALPAVQAVIDWKWNRFCKRLVLWELAFFLLWLFSFFDFTVVFQDEDTHASLHQLLSSARGRLTVACNILALVGMAPFLVIEVSTMKAYGLWNWATVWNVNDLATYIIQYGWSLYTWVVNVNDLATYIIQIAVVVMHLGRLSISSDWLSILASAQCILLLFRLQYFSRVFRATRFSFLDSLKEVIHDVKWYLVFLLLMLGGFATSFHILYRRDQEKHDNFSTIGKSIMTMVTWSAAADADLNPLYENAHNPVAGSVLACLFVFVLATVLMNLLISIMTNTLDKVTENEGLRMLLSKAQAIDELESTIPSWIERLFPGLYPAYLHVLRVDPDKLDTLDTVKLDRLWAKQGDDEERTLLDREESGNEDGGGGSSQSKPGTSTSARGGRGAAAAPGGPEGGASLAALQAQVAALQRDLAEVKELLLTQRRGGGGAMAVQ